MTVALLPLALPETSTFDQWRDQGARLCLAGRELNWIIGEWLDVGSTRYGREGLEAANAIFHRDEARLGPILATYRRFPEDRRHPTLTFGHHAAVMAVPDDAEADRLLTDAEAQTLTVAALRANVRVATDRQSTFIDDDPVDAAFRRIVQAWNLASREARQLFVESVQESDMGVIEL